MWLRLDMKNIFLSQSESIINSLLKKRQTKLQYKFCKVFVVPSIYVAKFTLT